MSNRKCCVPGCANSLDTAGPGNFHKFPNPVKDRQLFNTWVYSIGGDILQLENNHIFKYRRVCHVHFEPKYWCRNNRLAKGAVPTKNMPEPVPPHIYPQSSNIDVQMKENLEPVASQSQSIHSDRRCHSEGENVEVVKDLVHCNVHVKRASRKLVKRVAVTKTERALHQKMLQIGVKLSKCRNKVKKQAIKIKALQNITTNPQFLETLDKMSSTSKILTLLQFREHKKEVKGRRFTLEEKILALTILKQSPKGYRFLRKIFILPSRQILIKLIHMADINAGINKNLMAQVQKATHKMKPEHKLCVVLFDEMSLKPNVAYNERKDRVSGFVTNGQETLPEYADHAQVFMIRGLLKNFKQPVAYTFSQSATKGPELAKQLKAVITELQIAGLNVVATVCDQGTNNVNCIKYLLQETREKGIISEDAQSTADVLLFFDTLFDSVNGSYGKRKKHSKPLLGPATPNSVHHKTWTEAKIF
ncbi:hypothetical protein PYW08_008872 [Mythimna loreyi]|uniref:Uncharacterized protein n=1 Tax=Mythimna loreyi TaxID=667449 RepID=A0ACC2Q9U3_9NEOP|nr:hypothetical protein PYW08_008872 [Mythimna loreyi]